MDITDIINKKDFTSCHLFSHGDRVLYKVQALGNYRRFERMEKESFSPQNTGRHKSIQVGQDMYKVCFEKLSVTKFSEATTWSTAQGIAFDFDDQELLG